MEKKISASLALLICGCCFSLLTNAQSFLQPGFADYSFQIGKITKNYPVFPERKLAMMHTFSFGNQLNGTKLWHVYYNFPRGAFEFTYSSIGNKAVLGNMFTGLYKMEFPFKLSSKFYLEANPAFGAAYFNKPYDEIKNPDNTLIGSHITFCASATVGLRYYVNPFWSLQLHTGIYHCSNSHYQLPNLGVNLPIAGVGIRYHIQPVVILMGKREIMADKKLHIEMRIALGRNEQGNSTFPVNGPKYPIYLYACYGTKYVTPVNKLIVGLEGWYNAGVYNFITSQEFYMSKEHLKSTAAQAVVGHEFLMGHFGLMTNLGLYVYNPVYREKLKRENETDFRSELKGWVTARLGFQYYLKDATLHTRKNVFAGIYIKTNLGQADFLETSLGYCF
jgi:hypothetical protein